MPDTYARPLTRLADEVRVLICRDRNLDHRQPVVNLIHLDPCRGWDDLFTIAAGSCRVVKDPLGTSFEFRPEAEVFDEHADELLASKACWIALFYPVHVAKSGDPYTYRTIIRQGTFVGSKLFGCLRFGIYEISPKSDTIDRAPATYDTKEQTLALFRSGELVREDMI